ncbi:MAG TPA: response regulator [Limnobacter sp.]|nr:response regulator [Limnobacter sp.]
MSEIADLQPGGHLLLVDDEENVLNALLRVLRRDGYTLHTARSVGEAFDILARQPIEVVLSDQRMPEKSGAVFLSEVKELYPNTVRLMLSGYTEVGAVTEAINRGAIYKFLTKPWDDEQLRANVREAFQRHEMEAQNIRLHREVEEVNSQLLQLNHTLEQELQARNQRIRRDTSVVGVLQEMIDHLPLGLLGLDQAGELVWINQEASELLQLHGDCVLGGMLHDLPQPLADFLNDYLMSDTRQNADRIIQCGSAYLKVNVKPMGIRSNSSGCMVIVQAVKEGIA